MWRSTPACTRPSSGTHSHHGLRIGLVEEMVAWRCRAARPGWVWEPAGWRHRRLLSLRGRPHVLRRSQCLPLRAPPALRVCGNGTAAAAAAVRDRWQVLALRQVEKLSHAQFPLSCNGCACTGSCRCTRPAQHRKDRATCKVGAGAGRRGKWRWAGTRGRSCRGHGNCKSRFLLPRRRHRFLSKQCFDRRAKTKGSGR